jgi:hypothetical protein
VASLATLRVLEEEGLLERAQRVGAYFTEKLLEMKDKYELIGDVRGPGLMLGIELVYDKKTKEPARKEAYQFEKEGIQRGVLFGNSKYAGMGNVVKIKPPGDKRCPGGESNGSFEEIVKSWKTAECHHSPLILRDTPRILSGHSNGI